MSLEKARFHEDVAEIHIDLFVVNHLKVFLFKGELRVSWGKIEIRKLNLEVLAIET